MVAHIRSKPRSRTSGEHRRIRYPKLRPIVIWVPDIRDPAFLAEAHRQSVAVAASRSAEKNQVFIDAASDPDAV